MKVKFDSLNRFEVPKFYVCNPGCEYDGKRLTNVEGCLSDTSDEELIVNFNTTSELNFRAYRVKREDPEENEYTYNLYRKLQNRRLIFVEDVGFFVITQITDGYSDGIYYKDVHADSCETEIAQKGVPYIEDNTYPFTKLLENLVTVLPMWKIGTVDSAVASKHRTFEDVSEEYNVLGFMMEQMQEAYECLFIFDTINRLIHVYDQNNYVVRTPIYLTRNDVINSIEITENSDDLYTAISVLGDEQLNISPVNPLGTNVIYNFDYYLSWMSEELRKKVISWKSLVNSYTDEYYDKNLSYYKTLDEKINLEEEVAALDQQITLYQRMRDNVVATAESGDLPMIEQYNEAIKLNGGTVVENSTDKTYLLFQIDLYMNSVQNLRKNTNNSLESKTAELAAIEEEIRQIHQKVSMSENFSEKEYSELYNYIFQGSYTDEYIAVTESMSYEDKFNQMKILYDRAVQNLERVSGPTQELSLDVESFIFQKEFQDWTELLETGCLINAELQSDEIAMLFLSNMTVNYYDKTLSMTFGNRLYKFDPKSMFEDLLGDIKKTHNTLNYINDLLYPIKNGEFNAIREALQTSRDLTMNAALASKNEDVVIDESGYTGRIFIDDENGERRYDPRQIKITGKSIVFTDDAWESCELAIGEILLGDGQSVYGVNAKAILGDIIIGSELHIVNGDGQDMFKVTEDGVMTHVGKLNDRCSELELTDKALNVSFSNLETNGADKVTTTTGYTFNQEGLTIHKSGEEITNRLDNTGMYVERGSDNVLVANNEGVEAINLKSNQFLIVGKNSRFQDYTVNEVVRTGCFYIGV